MISDPPARQGRPKVSETNLGRLMRLDRQVRNHGVRQVSADIGISAATLSRLERGHQIDSATMLKLWQWLLRTAR